MALAWARTWPATKNLAVSSLHRPPTSQQGPPIEPAHPPSSLGGSFFPVACLIKIAPSWSAARNLAEPCVTKATPTCQSPVVRHKVSPSTSTSIQQPSPSRAPECWWTLGLLLLGTLCHVHSTLGFCCGAHGCVGQLFVHHLVHFIATLWLTRGVNVIQERHHVFSRG